MSASPKRKSGWAIIFIAIFFISPLKAIAVKEPIMRVLIAHEKKARFTTFTEARWAFFTKFEFPYKMDVFQKFT